MGVRNFLMLPEQLSTGTSSLLETEDKLSIVIEFVAGSDGSVHSNSVYRAIVRNMAQVICTLKEDAARKVGREMSKRMPAVASRLFVS